MRYKLVNFVCDNYLNGAIFQTLRFMYGNSIGYLERNICVVSIIIIFVGVSLDTMRQIEGYLLSRHYDGFMEKGHLRSRR